MNTIRKISLSVLLLTLTTSTFGWKEDGKTITVESRDDLWKLRGIMEEDKYNNFKDWTILLDSDIDAGGTEVNWFIRTIGWYDDHEFQGTFDGQGHTISNLYMMGEDGNRGLFGDIKDATIKNLKLVDPYIQCGDYDDGNCHVGALVGRAKGNCTITNCAVVGGTVRAVSGYQDEMGGICGFVKGTCNISNCYATCTISGRSQLGGIVGKLSEDYEGEGSITNCYFAGTLDAHDDGGSSEDVNPIIGERNGMSVSNNYSSDLTKAELFGTDVNAYVYRKDNNPELALFYNYPVGESFYSRLAATIDETDTGGYFQTLKNDNPLKVMLVAVNTHVDPCTSITVPSTLTTYFDKEVTVTAISQEGMTTMGTCDNLMLPATLDSIAVPLRHNVQTAFTFADDNNAFAIIDNALCQTSTHQFITIPKALTTLTVNQQDCDSIADYAFENSSLTKLYVNTYVAPGISVSEDNVPVVKAHDDTFTDASEDLDIYIKDGTQTQLFFGVQGTTKGYGYINAVGWRNFFAKFVGQDQHIFSYFPLKRNPGRMSTLILGYPVELPEGMTAWWAQSITTGDNNVVNLQKFTTQIVPALTPVLVTYSGTDLIYLTRYEGDDAGSATDYENNLFKGSIDPGGHTMTDSELTTNFFTLGRPIGDSSYDNLGFYPYHPTNHILPSYVAWIASSDIPANAKLMMDFEPVVTAIDNTLLEPSLHDQQQVYTLQGVHIDVTAMKKGHLYIVNGKKVLIR